MKDSQINPQEHSEIKVLLLRKYLEKYISILAHSPFISEVEVYDLFCGEGIYENGKTGSPVIILNLIRDIYLKYSSNFQGDINFKCVFNDFNKDKIAKLQKYISENNISLDGFGSFTCKNVDYNEIKIPLLDSKTPGNRRRFIFIDPYGYKDIKITDIERMLSDGFTEVLLFLPTQFMYRFEKEATPDSLQIFLNDAMQDIELKSSKSGIDFINNLQQGFSNRLITKHVDSFIITREGNQYFAMFFFANHLYGLEKFLEAKWDIDEEQGRGWSPKSAGQIDLFNPVDSSPVLDKFEENLKVFLREKRTNIEVHRFTILNRHLVKHTNIILKDLQDRNKLKVTLNDGKDARKGSFYIRWDDVKTREPKSYIQIV
ncbi:MAG: three-Cys-motif partner protein TcmP [Bacteroidetes bacterium]|nr:three-Cys-motif partner protein TcmP [Bacteroidota bacterium]